MPQSHRKLKEVSMNIYQSTPKAPHLKPLPAKRMSIAGKAITFKKNPTPNKPPRKTNTTTTISALSRTKTPNSTARKLQSIVNASAKRRAPLSDARLQIPQSHFHSIVKNIVHSQFQNLEMRWALRALQALQEASEEFMISYFEDCLLAANHAKRITIMVKDSQLIKRIRKLHF